MVDGRNESGAVQKKNKIVVTRSLLYNKMME